MPSVFLGQLPGLRVGLERRNAGGCWFIDVNPYNSSDSEIGRRSVVVLPLL